jgi:hypothetical protein
VHVAHVNLDRACLTVGNFGINCGRVSGNVVGSPEIALAAAAFFSCSLTQMLLVHPCSVSKIGRNCTHSRRKLDVISGTNVENMNALGIVAYC